MTTINIIVIYHWRVPSFRLSTCAVGPWEREALTAKNEAKPGGYLVAKMADHMMVTYREKAEKWIQQVPRLGVVDLQWNCCISATAFSRGYH